MADVKQSSFARDLSDALARSSLSSEEIARRLQDLGYLVGITSLSSWCRGESLPRNSLAFQLAGSMEDILDVQKGKLCESLLRDLFPVKPFISDENITPELVTLASRSDAGNLEDSYSVTEDTDWTIDVHRLVVRDELRVSADYKTLLSRTTIGLLVPPMTNPAVEVGVSIGEDESFYQDKFLLEVHGAYIGEETCVESGGKRTYFAKLVLNAPNITPGDIAFCSYVRGDVSQVEQTYLAWRFFHKELDFYSCTILFEGQAPQSAEYVTASRYDNRELVVTPLEVQNNCVKVDIRNFGRAGQSGFIRYRL